MYFVFILHVSYSSILVEAIGFSQYYANPVQCRGSVNSGGGGEVLAIFEISRGEEFSGSRG